MTTTDPTQFEGELQQVFAQEARELLQRIEKTLLEIEQSTDAAVAESLRKIRRDLHTLKGAAGAMEIVPIIHLCHALEEGVAHCQESGQPIAVEQFDAFYRAVAFMSDWIDDENSDQFDPVLQQVQQVFDEQAGAQQPTPSPPLSSGPGDDGDSETGSRANPPHNGGPGGDGGGEESPPSPSRSTAPSKTSTVRVASSKLDDLQAVAGELVVVNLQQQESKRRVESIRDDLAEVLSKWRTFYGDLREFGPQLPTDIWHGLQQRASNLALGLKQLHQDSYDFARWSVGQTGRLERVSETLEDGLRNIRMQPLGPFFDGFARVVRDAARSDDKQARFESKGRDIEVDRAVLERLREPLIHLVRNAVAHGIEMPDQRRRAGKSPAGTVSLRARPVGEKVQLVVRDDGAGIDATAVRHQAVDAGLVSSMDAAAERPLLDLLTHPGLSTRRDTDELAGRGIGLEAVATTITELGGRLELDNSPGQGAAFRLTIPSTITTSEGLIAEVGSYRLGIQLTGVQRVVRTDPDQMRTIDGQQIIDHEGDPIALISLAKLVGVPDGAPDLEQESHPALILKHGKRRMAVVVDDIPGQIPMVVKPLGPQFEEVQHLAGGAIQTDGSILPVVEHRALFRTASGRRLSTTTSGMANSTPAPPTAVDDSDQPATILVVDDSITTRALERNILEAAGHRVLTATDGVEALETLRTAGHQGEIDLLVTDLDMPRVGGLELCRSLREDPRLDLPVIIVTSKGDEDEIRQGLEAGADAYIVKGNFDQDHFMTTVNRFVSQ